MDTVSVETAKRLSEAGFPQPETIFRQLWVSGDLTYQAAVGTAAFEMLMHHGSRTMIYCPIATDILRELPGFSLSLMQGGGFGVFKVGGRGMFGFDSENAAEACAEAWLNKNSPTP